MIFYIQKVRDGYVIADGPAAIGYNASMSRTLGPTFKHCADADGFARNVLGATDVVPTWMKDDV